MDSYTLTPENLEEMFPDVGQRTAFIKRLMELTVKREQDTAEEGSAQVQPSTSRTSDGGKRKHDDPELAPNKRKRRRNKRKLDSKLKEVKMIMSHVDKNLSETCEKSDEDNNDKKVIDFLRELMQNLNKEKKELVGVFGKTGAGKSSLINAVIGEEDLLPTGTSRACTSVIIKVEGNTENQNYEAIVEFISGEELEDLLLSTKHLFVTSLGEKEKVDAESKDNSDKMTALFGNDWRDVPYETFMYGEKYREMSTYIQQTQSLQSDSSSTLSYKLVHFIKNVRNPSSPLYWPVVKCVTIKVPNRDLLRHMTLVDLPGTGDRNKTRNDMWKEMVSSCGTVWIVTDMTRPESDKEPWEILQSACSILGNGGECRNIHFICTKADQCLDELSPEDTKTDIIQEFQALSEVQNHFPDDCFKVFIVSTKEEIMPPEKNEISDLEEFLVSLNNPEERVQRYVSDAYGILALMMGARSQNAQQKKAVFDKLNARANEELKKMITQMEPVHETFERILTEGVNLAKQQWESALDKKLGSINSYKRLRSIICHNGVQETNTGDHINLNTTLSSFLTNSIDRRFRETFPNTAKEGPFYGAVHAFSLDPECLTENNKDVELLLKFLKREEEKVKAKLCEDIRRYKKQIYGLLTKTVTKEMSAGYTEAKRIKGLGAVEQIKQTLKEHVRRNEGMFDEAKDKTLKELQKVMRRITTDIVNQLTNAMIVSLKSDMTAVPDFTQEFNKVMRFYNGD